MMAMAVLHSLAFSARLIGGSARQLSKMLISLYDILIMLPLGIERLVAVGLKKKDKDEPTEELKDVYLEKQS